MISSIVECREEKIKDKAKIFACVAIKIMVLLVTVIDVKQGLKVTY